MFRRLGIISNKSGWTSIEADMKCSTNIVENPATLLCIEMVISDATQSTSSLSGILKGR